MSGRGPIALVGRFGIDNYGNEATLAAMLRALDERGVRDLVVVCDVPERVRADFGVRAAALAPRRRPGGPSGPLGRLLGKAAEAWRALAIARHASALVLVGTGMLEGVWVEAGGLPLTLFLLAVGARLLRRRFDVVAAGIDLAGSRWTCRLYGATLRLATSVSVRDAPSADAAQTLGLRRRPTVVPDQALALTPTVPPAGESAGRSADEAGGGDRSLVVVGVMDYAGRGVRQPPEARNRYLTSVTELVVRLLDEGWAVRLVPGAAPDVPAMHDVAGRVTERLPDAPLASSAARSYVEAVADMAGARVVTASRYHTVVGALAAGVPVVPFGYGFKHDAIVTRFGLPAGVDVDTFEPADLAARVADLDARHDELVGRIREAGRQARTELAGVYDELVAALPAAAVRAPQAEVPA